MVKRITLFLALVSVGCRTAAPAPFTLAGLDIEQARRTLLSTTNELRLSETQRFVPPLPIVAADRTVSGIRPVDAYSMALDSGSQRLYDLTHQYLGPALTNIVTARTAAERTHYRIEAFHISQDVLRLLPKLPVDEWNEERYVRLINAQVAQLGMAVKVNP